MKRKNNSVIKKIANEYIILPLSEHNISADVILKTNEVGALIYNALIDETTFDNILDLICNTYEVLKDDAKADLEEFLKLMKSKGLLDD